VSSGNALVFGAGGALGSAIAADLAIKGFDVFTAGSTEIARASDASVHIQVAYDTLPTPQLFHGLPELHAVVWAQGLNASDSITSFDPATFQRLWQSNVLFIAASLSSLLSAEKLVDGSRLCVISSIWQLESRLGKLSYTVSKAALQGLVKSCAIDLGSRGILINAVLPGAVDTPMTRNQLSSEQIAAIISQTALGRLADPEDIATATSFLVSPSNRFITGQFLTVDGGFIGFKHT
jgi:NAD(P)-dependent dehydrogenase (short-subunit alcohol dehydrogenase family)